MAATAHPLDKLIGVSLEIAQRMDVSTSVKHKNSLDYGSNNRAGKPEMFYRSMRCAPI